jgi:hypothetical protein
MTTTVTREIKQDHPESQEWPTLASDLADTTREGRADRFDRVQGRKIGTDPYDDPTRARYGAAIAPKRSIHMQKRTT